MAELQRTGSGAVERATDAEAPARAEPGRGRSAAGNGGGPASPEEARRRIEATRRRLSDSIDRLGDELAAKKAELKQKADVLSPTRERIRDRPLPALGGAFVVGVLAGLVTKGRKRAKRQRGERERRTYRDADESMEVRVDVEGQPPHVLYPQREYSWLHELRSVLMHQLSNALIATVAGIVSAKVAERQHEAEEREAQPPADPFGFGG